ncbi:sigma-70 family RNA polymerase sigma factor [Clostridium sp. MCC353]|uniref:sigma-70 family RNA polymerase sigma factor n=1 Tax=Clostridium sp. MCC353 TaxID=2592646 RepID=UPI001C00C3DE|nr:sigma-70 family RNA polymerase sigma factor [Clostridium sp. MCC353]MBT9774965.1 sigma-70 family RNA polymerase sigma factor [Clostridium sp. MCC353]
MQKEHQIIKAVYAAKRDMQKADDLIRAYIPFIRSEASKFLSRPCTDQNDEYSIAMIAFHEAVLGYAKDRGSFLNYASMTIRSRLIDYQRKESRHQGHISLNAEGVEEDRPLLEELADEKDHFEESANLEATKQEIAELASVMSAFGISFSDVADNSPRQERTLETCSAAIRYAAGNRSLLEELLRTKKLPMARLALGSGCERKTLERHRKYILAMLLIQTNGFEIIRGHLMHILNRKGGGPV